MSDINPENFAEFCTQDGPGCPSLADEDTMSVADLQPPDMVSDPHFQIVLLPQTLVER